MHGDGSFLVSFPSFEDLDRVDGIHMPVNNALITFSAWKSLEVPHKLELKKVWLHVEGVPHTLRTFLGLWAVGSLMGITQDVDLYSLRRRGVVRILVAMFNDRVLDKMKDDVGPFVSSDDVVKLKALEFRFRH